MGRGIIYQCSDTRYSDGTPYIGDVGLWEKLESGQWTPFCWDDESGTEWVMTDSGEVIALEPVERDALPETVVCEPLCAGISVDQE